MNKRPRPRLLYLLAASLLLGILWAAFFEIDQTVRTQGQFIPGARTQLIQAVDGGVLTEIKVQEGAIVKAGQVLAVLESARARAAFDESDSRQVALRIALLRAQAEAIGKQPVFGQEFSDYPQLIGAQKTLYAQRKRGLDDTLKALNQTLLMAQEELAMNEALAATGDTSKVEVLRAKRQVAEIGSRIAEIRNKYLQDARTEAAKLEEELLSQGYRKAERFNVLEHTELTSPLDGVVKVLRINTVGGVLRAGEEIMQISPTDGELLLEVRINPADIGLLRVGQTTSLRLDAFDYTLYGTLTGELIYLSSDTLSDSAPNGQTQTYYRGRIRLAPNALTANPKLQKIEFRPGMTATVDIKTGHRTVLGYLLKPITRAFAESMNER